jgi:hypothetical protein
MSNTDSIAQASATAAATTATNIMNAPSGPLTHSGGDAHVS